MIKIQGILGYRKNDKLHVNTEGEVILGSRTATLYKKMFSLDQIGWRLWWCPLAGKEGGVGE